MSAKPIDEFLAECNVWLEKIAAAKQREMRAQAEIEALQSMEKEAAALLRFGARAGGALLRGGSKLLSRVGAKLRGWGSKLTAYGNKVPQPTGGLQNPLAKQVVAAKNAGNVGPKMVKATPTSPAKMVRPKPAATPKTTAAPKADAGAGAAGGGTPAAGGGAPAAGGGTPAPANAPVQAPRPFDASRYGQVNGNYVSKASGKTYSGEELAKKYGMQADQLSGVKAYKNMGGFKSSARSWTKKNPMPQSGTPAPANAPVNAPKAPTSNTAGTPTSNTAGTPTSNTAGTTTSNTAGTSSGNAAGAPKGNTAGTSSGNAAGKQGAGAGAADDAAGATANGAAEGGGMLGAIAPYALVGGGAFVAGRATAPETYPVSPAQQANLNSLGQ